MTFSVRLNELGDRFGDLAKLADISNIKRSTMYGWAKGKTEPKLSDIIKLSNATNVAVDWLVNGSESDARPHLEETQQQFTAQSDVQVVPMVDNPAPLPQDIPLLGTASGAITGMVVITGDMLEYVKRPPGLATVPNAYALYVAGSSMEPRYFAGDMVFVHPHKPIRAGDDIVIQQKEGDHSHAFIKRFVKADENNIEVQQHNPVATIEYPKSTVLAVHRVMTMGELFGA